MNYYNEYDKKAAAWLRELIKAGLIAEGEVDERSIADIKATELSGYTQCHFFAGIGGWSYALRLAGWPDDRPVWTGSCPCQPFSTAGKGLGEKDSRHLWPVFARLISERKPTKVFGEQVASKAGREWLNGVRLDLEGMGYAAGAADLCTASVSALHIRQRLFWVADSKLPCTTRQRTDSRETETTTSRIWNGIEGYCGTGGMGVTESVRLQISGEESGYSLEPSSGNGACGMDNTTGAGSQQREHEEPSKQGSDRQDNGLHQRDVVDLGRAGATGVSKLELDPFAADRRPDRQE